jgi:hypothetical protein
VVHISSYTPLHIPRVGNFESLSFKEHLMSHVGA